MKKIVFVLSCVLGVITTKAQNVGDTIVVQAFDWSMPLLNNGGLAREMVVPFPDNPSLTYEKVIMQYNMRCRGAAVNTTGGNYVACGEWDYSCNTYVHDSTRVDSTLNYAPSHLISDFSGTSFNYTNTPTYKSYRYLQQNVVLNSIVSENQYTIGSGTSSLDHVFASNTTNGKSQYLYKASELTNAGVTAGEIDALLLDVLTASGNSDYLRIKLKATTDTVLTAQNLHLTGFTEVYFNNSVLTAGNQRLQFYSPFTWDGTSNVIVEFSFTNPDENTGITIEGESTTFISGLTTSNEKYFKFNGENYIEANTYKGIDGNLARSSEAWIKTTVNNKEITSWGLNSASQKWNFRLNGDGTVRVEVNGGFIYGTTVIDDGEWHHIACTFSGTDVQHVKLYVDGELETVANSSSEPVLTNTTDGINLRISRGTNNRYFNGIIDDVRLWDTELTQTEIQNWMHRTLDSGHPQYANLQTDYQLNEGEGDAISDHSIHNRNAMVLEGEHWQSPHGVALFKGWEPHLQRPNLTFAQGDYDLTITNDTVYDLVYNEANFVREREVNTQNGLVDDEINTISSLWMFEAVDHEFYDENGVLINTESVNVDGTITIQDLAYYKRLPMRYELLSFVTPYGIGLDLGQNGKTWNFDLTDFLPVLKGDKRISMERGGQWNEEYDIKFLFVVGTPPRDVLNIEQIWRNDSKGYVQIMNDESFEQREVVMHADAEAFKIKSTITGHGQEGEFIPRDHFININGGTTEFTYTVWKECADNPIFPQGGTWIYDRAGWCPGKASDLHEFDITPYVTPGQTHQIDYGVVTASGTSNYIVNNQLVSYGGPNFTLDAKVVEIINPTDYIEYDRINPVCTTPKVVIQNTGSTNLTSVTIEYWVNTSATPQTYTWTGDLGFLEKQDVELPTPLALWDDLSSVNTFYVELKNPNGLTDEYPSNNKQSATFKIPDVLPSHFYVQFKTNNAGAENTYTLKDDVGNTIFSRSAMNNNTTYKDTFNLTYGCYTLTVTDSDDDGISFWANNDGSGYLRLREVGGTTLKSFEPDFGKSIHYQFTVTNPLASGEMDVYSEIKVFPNPAKTICYLSGEGIGMADIQFYDQLGKLNAVHIEKEGNQAKCNTSELTSGIYFIKITLDSKVITRKLIVE